MDMAKNAIQSEAPTYNFQYWKPTQLSRPHKKLLM